MNSDADRGGTVIGEILAGWAIVGPLCALLGPLSGFGKLSNEESKEGIAEELLPEALESDQIPNSHFLTKNNIPNTVAVGDNQGSP